MNNLGTLMFSILKSQSIIVLAVASLLFGGCQSIGTDSMRSPLSSRLPLGNAESSSPAPVHPAQRRTPTPLEGVTVQAGDSSQTESQPVAGQGRARNLLLGDSASVRVGSNPSESTRGSHSQPVNDLPFENGSPRVVPVSRQEMLPNRSNQESPAVFEQNSGEGVSTIFRGQSPDEEGVAQVGYFQQPETQLQGGPPSAVQYGTIRTGSPNEPLSLLQNTAPGGVAPFPNDYTAMQGVADLNVVVGETQTGRINFGGAFNSENGLVGQFVIDERNFDIGALPRSFQDIVDGTAFRGAGQSFRLELVPGNEVQRYLVSFGEPFLFNTAVSLNVSAYLFDRQYFDWDEQRLGGRIALGYRLTPDISVSAGLRMENVDISDPRLGTSPQLNAVLGDTDLYVGHVGITSDTRDHPFMATEGTYLSMTYSQAFGEFDYARGDIDYRRYRLLYQRPDGSGRHTLSFGTRLGFSGSQTPVFENYFAGGFSSLRGFDFRGASPSEGGVRVGGEFQWLNSLEYTFPLTADDMIKGVLFCDFGTVEESITLDADNFRVAPGFGFRVHMPAAGIGAPLAFDFAFPVSSSEFDDEQIFSFYLGVLR